VSIKVFVPHLYQLILQVNTCVYTYIYGVNFTPPIVSMFCRHLWV